MGNAILAASNFAGGEWTVLISALVASALLAILSWYFCKRGVMKSFVICAYTTIAALIIAIIVPVDMAESRGETRSTKIWRSKAFLEPCTPASATLQ